MLSTQLTTVDNTILSNEVVITSTIRGVQSLLERRTANHKIFGKLDLIMPTTPTTTAAAAAAAEPRNIIAGFLLDTSGSMKGDKLAHAVNTIKKIMEVLHSERNGKTLQCQPIHAWIYVITFNTVTELVIPFQEITEETISTINKKLDNIKADGCTNYEIAFRKQTEVIEEIIRKLNDPEHPHQDPQHPEHPQQSVAGGRNPHQQSVAGGRNPQQSVAGGRNPQQFHLIRFFETDGEITDGSSNTSLLCKMMRSTSTATTTTTTESTNSNHRITFEDYVIGYGTNVDLGCLKELAAPYHPSTVASSLVTILNTEDIGFKTGEILFKLIMRCGNNWEISVETSDDATAVELFEYQTNEWGAKTSIHSMIYGEKRSLWIQYTPSSTGHLPPIQVNIKYENQFTEEKFTYQFEHEIPPRALPTTTAADNGGGVVVVVDAVTTVIPMINGMIQIEIFKMFREIEAERYDKDTIVREAYKILRMLKSIESNPSISSYSEIICQTQNLITDVKVIIGMTTIQDPKKMKMVIHDRRICSGEQEVFNSGATFSRKYVKDEEEFEEDAIRVINAAKTKTLAAATAATTNATDHPLATDIILGPACALYEEFNDALPSRLPTFSHQDDYVDSVCGGRRNVAAAGAGAGAAASASYGSEIRALCVRIAVSRNKNEDTSAEELYQEMQKQQYGNGRYYQYDPEEYVGGGGYDYQDDTFSSTPMNDDYTQRRIGIMRHVSS